MIKINLLGDETGIDHTKKFVLIAYTASLVICVLICWFLLNSINGEIQQLTQTTEDLEGQLAKLQKKTKSVRDLDKKKQLLTSKLALIAKLKKSKIGPVRVLDDLNVAVPSRVWLRRVVEEAGSIEIKGRAINNKDIVTFIRNLDASDYFTEVELSESNLMFYSKKSGKVVPAKSIQALRASSPDFGTEGRSTKASGMGRSAGSGGRNRFVSKVSAIHSRDGTGASGKRGKKWAVRSGNGSGKGSALDAQYVRINEFLLRAKVNYHGQIIVAQSQSKSKTKTRRE